MKLESSFFNPRNRESAVDYVFNAVITAINSHQLAPGGRLPTESELSQSLGVGRNSVREAVKKLEAYGIVRIQRSEGTFVCQEYNQRMLDPVLYGILLQPNRWRNFAQLRGALEIGTLYYACNAVTQNDLDDLEQLLKIMEQQLSQDQPDTEAILETDRRFHARIAQITQNPMICDVAEYIAKITLISRRATLQSVLYQRQTAPFLQKHRALLDVLRYKDWNKVPQAVLTHYENWETPDEI